MASILDRYGIKEVADFTFYHIGEDGKPDFPVLYLDTLKVSTTEQTGEQAEARGGKGNAPIIMWDYNKEINVTLEDALFSAKSLAIMFGDGKVRTLQKGKAPTGADASDGVADSAIMKTEIFTYVNTGKTGETKGGKPTETDSHGWNSTYTAPNGKTYKKINPKFYKADVYKKGDTDTTSDFVDKEKYFCSYDLKIIGSVIEISANSFPGTYYCTGDTFARSENSGEDEFFQLIFPKAKVTSENTITLEAEGDPSTFNMNLRILRPADGIMMKLVKYDLIEEIENGNTGDADTTTLPHNHNLATKNPDLTTGLVPLYSGGK